MTPLPPSLLRCEYLTNPLGLAVIGASNQPESVGHSLLANLLVNRSEGCAII
jgi:acyl-CoA synthetase (NDP forming)